MKLQTFLWGCLNFLHRNAEAINNDFTEMTLNIWQITLIIKKHNYMAKRRSTFQTLRQHGAVASRSSKWNFTKSIFHLLDLKTCQNTKDFALISGRVDDILWLSDVSARWSTVCHEFFMKIKKLFLKVILFFQRSRKRALHGCPRVANRSPRVM